MFRSGLSTARDFQTPWYRRWKDELSLGERMHRKAWELAIVAETLESNGMLSSGRRGVGFGVGNEPFPQRFAELGCEILATDLGVDGWSDAHDFQTRLAHPQVLTRVVDMNWIHGSNRYGAVEEAAYDFSWSVCSLDHCGSVWLSKRFLLNQMNCLKAGAIAVHTAEYSFAPQMPREGGTSFFRHDDVLDLIELWKALGHEPAEMDWFLGDQVHDHVVDRSPFTGEIHLKMEFGAGQWTTCIVFAAKKTERSQTLWLDVDETIARRQILESA